MHVEIIKTLVSSSLWPTEVKYCRARTLKDNHTHVHALLLIHTNVNRQPMNSHAH